MSQPDTTKRTVAADAGHMVPAGKPYATAKSDTCGQTVQAAAGATTHSPGAQGSKMSRAGPKGLKVVSNWKFCAESENQRLTCRTWEVF